MNCYKKMFISEITKNWKGENLKPEAVKVVMKSSILGVITGIQKFSRRTIYTVDDGTGSLDCVFWLENLSAKRISDSLNIHAGTNTLNSETMATCQLLLNKININEDELIYAHGDAICCLGIIKIVKGKLLLDMNYHYKADKVNTETLWILDVLSCHHS